MKDYHPRLKELRLKKSKNLYRFYYYMMFVPRMQGLSFLGQLEVFNFNTFIFFTSAMIKLQAPSYDLTKHNNLLATISGQLPTKYTAVVSSQWCIIRPFHQKGPILTQKSLFIPFLSLPSQNKTCFT